MNRTGWLNVYWRGGRYHSGGLYQTKEQADAIAKPWRVAAVEVKLPPKPIEGIKWRDSRAVTMTRRVTNDR